MPISIVWITACATVLISSMATPTSGWWPLSRTDIYFLKNSMLRFLQQFRQMIAPDRRPCVGPVAARLVCDRQQHVLAVFHALNVAIHNFEFGRVDLVIG